VPDRREAEIGGRGGGGDVETGGRRGGELRDGVEEPARLHDDLDLHGVALEGDLLGAFGLVGIEVAGRGHAGFFEEDAEGGAEAGVREAADAWHAEGLVAEGVGTIPAEAGAVAVIVGFGEARIRRVGCAEDLERFEKGYEGDLEVGEVAARIRTVIGGLGERAVESGEESFVEKDDSWECYYEAAQEIVY